MPTDAIRPSVFVVGPAHVSSIDAEAALDGAAVARAEVILIEVTGPAAVQCLQGLLTNDIEASGNSGFVYGAVLTPKGMIICDLWVAREEGHLTLVAPTSGRGALLDVFKRTLPPRLAGTRERSEEVAVLRMIGPAALITADDCGIAVPDPGTTVTGNLSGIDYSSARPSLDMPFALQLTCALSDHERLLALLADAGAAAVPAPALELARIVAGWPRLGAEIDHKTLPQEVRFDDIDGVSYTKGCYTGQETVARLHFRGHTNRRLAGLFWGDEPEPAVDGIMHQEKTVGRVTSVAWLHRLDRYAGLCVIRNTVATGEFVTAANSPAKIVDVPFQFDA